MSQSKGSLHTYPFPLSHFGALGRGTPECSPLVILSDDGKIYWPIADTTPSSGQNENLLPFAGQKVTASGKVFQRGGSTAMVIEKIELQAGQK